MYTLTHCALHILGVGVLPAAGLCGLQSRKRDASRTHEVMRAEIVGTEVAPDLDQIRRPTIHQLK
jgi:hypothetical protein